MSSTTLPAPGAGSEPVRTTDHSDLASLGYDQQLHRSLGKFASFAAGFSFVSILTTIFQLFGLGFSLGPCLGLGLRCGGFLILCLGLLLGLRLCLRLRSRRFIRKPL